MPHLLHPFYQSRPNEELARIKSAVAPLLAKIQLQSELQSKTEAGKKEQQKLNDISIKNNNLKTKRAAYAKKTDEILKTYNRLNGQ